MHRAALNILIVDDDSANAEALGELFELEGHNPFIARSGDEALSIYLQQNFDLTFMDVVMPGKNGVETFLELKRMKPLAKVVMMTGYSVEHLLHQALEYGALGVLTKPMDSRRIIDLVNDVGPNGLVIAPACEGNEAQQMTATLSAAGHACHIISNTQSQPEPSTIGADHVLVYDLHVPLIEGMGVFAGLRKSGVSATAIMLADTAGNGEDAEALLRDTKATGILNKPFDPEELLRRLPVLAA